MIDAGIRIKNPNMTTYVVKIPANKTYQTNKATLQCMVTDYQRLTTIQRNKIIKQ
jgi:hypothetical protein